ncbi:hypothetical protein [Streptomyces sp. NRRL S-378]|uniref:hypothetical protein n=1 Tax=Streptomyces sp. NRRL S-378 TaxID=1463904 RepID=UPI00131CDE2D|nr:hypothetical protein [Streptomyces sp. NRRL S-378]
MEAWEAGQAATDPADDIAYARLLQRIRERLPVTYEPDWAALRRTVHNTPGRKPDVLCDGCGQEIGLCERCGLPTTSRPGSRWLHRGTTCTTRGPLTPRQSDPLPRPPLQLPPLRLDFPAGPVAVIDYCDGALFAHLSKDRTSDCPQTLAELLAWTHTEGLGAVRLHNRGHHQSPLLVLTSAATRIVGLPETLNDPISRPLPPGPSRPRRGRLATRRTRHGPLEPPPGPHRPPRPRHRAPGRAALGGALRRRLGTGRTHP